jgi:hypothetical protein
MPAQLQTMTQVSAQEMQPQSTAAQAPLQEMQPQPMTQAEMNLQQAQARLDAFAADLDQRILSGQPSPEELSDVQPILDRMAEVMVSE